MADPAAALVALIMEEGRTFESRISQGQVPNPQQLLGFLKTLVSKATPLAQAAAGSRPDVADTTRGGFTSIGWDVATNGPIPGSQPPDPNAVLQMLKMLVQKLNAAQQPAPAQPQQPQQPERVPFTRAAAAAASRPV